MKIRGASALLGCAVLLLMTAPPIHAQRGGGGRAGGGAGGPGGGGGGGRGGSVGGGRPVNPPGSVNVPTSTPRVTTTTLPSSPILPITNPVGPILPTDGTAGTTRRVPVGVRSNPNRRDNVILVGSPYGYWPGYYPYYDGFYSQPYLEPAPIPGELPGTYRYQQAANDPPPGYYAQPAPPPAPSPIVEPESVFYPDQNFIVTLPEPDRVVVPPPVGTSRSDVLARYGEPWGSMKTSGKETLYFKGGLTLVFEGGKVSEIR